MTRKLMNILGIHYAISYYSNENNNDNQAISIHHGKKYCIIIIYAELINT